MRMCFPWGLLAFHRHFNARYAAFPSPLSRGLLSPHCRGEEDMLNPIRVTFQRSMYCVTSAVIQALRTALHPLDDPNPKHLQANREFFEAQIDRFCRPEYGMKYAAKLKNIQTSDYR